MFDELLEAIQEKRWTVLIWSHDLAALERYADHIGVLHQGRMIAEGPTTALVERYRMIDATLTNGLFGRHAAIHHMQCDGQHVRFMLDTSALPVQRIAALGAENIVEAPLTLEEVFVNLVSWNRDRPCTAQLHRMHVIRCVAWGRHAVAFRAWKRVDPV